METGTAISPKRLTLSSSVSWRQPFQFVPAHCLDGGLCRGFHDRFLHLRWEMESMMLVSAEKRSMANGNGERRPLEVA